MGPYETTWTHDDGSECDLGREGPGWCSDHGMRMRLRILPIAEVPGLVSDGLTGAEATTATCEKRQGG